MSVKFSVGYSGLETRIADIVSEKDMSSSDSYLVNHKYEDVSVRTEADKEKWITLKNEWLECAWTPNQIEEDRDRNAERMQKIEQELKELEIDR